MSGSAKSSKSDSDYDALAQYDSYLGKSQTSEMQNHIIRSRRPPSSFYFLKPVIQQTLPHFILIISWARQKSCIYISCL